MKNRGGYQVISKFPTQNCTFGVGGTVGNQVAYFEKNGVWWTKIREGRVAEDRSYIPDPNGKGKTGFVNL